MADTKTCPDCAEEVKADANVCRFCGNQFGTAEAEAANLRALVKREKRRRWQIAAAVIAIVFALYWVNQQPNKGAVSTQSDTAATSANPAAPSRPSQP